MLDQALQTELSQSGFALLRNPGQNIENFEQLVETSSIQTGIDPAREFFAKNVQLVDSGTDAIGLHCENGATPYVPHLVYFYCVDGPFCR